VRAERDAVDAVDAVINSAPPVSKLTIVAKNFRALEYLKWSPASVCLLCGPNGAGKSTALSIFRFLRILFDFGLESALQKLDGQHFRRHDAPENEPVFFEVSVDDLRWRLRFPMSLAGLRGPFGEELYRGQELVVRAAMFDEGWYLGTERHPRDERRCCAKVLWDRGDADWMAPLTKALLDMRVYDSYWLNQVQSADMTDTRSAYLAERGSNLWTVLANWKTSPINYNGQFEAVMSAARQAFPGLISTVEFARGFPDLFPPGATEAAQGLPPKRAAEGLLTGLLHLTALFGARTGSLLAFDEVENQLHPHAIRALLAAMRRRAEERELTVVLTTHSPVVLNAFREEPEQVYVLERKAPGAPVPAAMTELHSEEWLAQAKLGTLYDQLAFGAPTAENNPAPVPPLTEDGGNEA
jgi:predicted ATPase